VGEAHFRIKGFPRVSANKAFDYSSAIRRRNLKISVRLAAQFQSKHLKPALQGLASAAPVKVCFKYPSGPVAPFPCTDMELQGVIHMMGYFPVGFAFGVLPHMH